jgi:type IV pilus assembly protein PilE
MTGLQAPFKGNSNDLRSLGAVRAPLRGRSVRRVHAMAAAVRGFTMIEVLIVVAIITILTTVALPAYNNTVVRANRAAAQSYLLDLANREEQFLLDARTYTTTIGDLLAPPTTVTPYYTVTIAVPVGSSIANAYKITATPVASSIQENEDALTIDQDGVKTGTW